MISALKHFSHCIWLIFQCFFIDFQCFFIDFSMLFQRFLLIFQCFSIDFSMLFHWFSMLFHWFFNAFSQPVLMDPGPWPVGVSWSADQLGSTTTWPPPHGSGCHVAMAQLANWTGHVCQFAADLSARAALEHWLPRRVCQPGTGRLTRTLQAGVLTLHMLRATGTRPSCGESSGLHMAAAAMWAPPAAAFHWFFNVFHWFFIVF